MIPDQPASVRVLCAERPGVGGVSEDRVVVLPNGVIVLDGATSAAMGPGAGGWYADLLGGRLEELLHKDAGRDLRKLLAEAISDVTADYGLRPGESPSSTVVIVRWTDEQADALVLGDSALVAFGVSGEVEKVQDSRIYAIPNAKRSAYLARLKTGSGFADDDRELVRAFQAETRRHRNQDGGYWIAEAAPEAAFQAEIRSWPRRSLAAMLLATDGVASGIEEYGTPPSWQEALSLAMTDGPDALVDLIHQVEDSDPQAQRWPRFKRHDDKALAVVTFNQ